MNANLPRQFVDTNVLVYVHDKSAGAKYERAAALVTGLWEAGNGCLSTQVLQEFYVTVTRKVARPLTGETAAQIVADLGKWRVHAPGVQDVLGAIEIHRRFDVSFWDALILRSASQLGCLVVWSEDLNPGQGYGLVRVQNPF
jgi:predicted nucleic acid-binding protein